MSLKHPSSIESYVHVADTLQLAMHSAALFKSMQSLGQFQTRSFSDSFIV